MGIAVPSPSCVRPVHGFSSTTSGPATPRSTHLTQLPISAVKIDKSFVAGVPGHNRQAAVVAALVGLSSELGIDVIAEGVETAGQLQALQRIKCRSVQEFLFDRPAAKPSLDTPAVPTPLLGRRRRPA